MLGRNAPTQILSTVATVGLLATAATGCLPVYDSAFIEREDVNLEVTGGDSFRSGGEQGEVHALIEDTAVEVNGWVGETVQELGQVIAILNQYPETERDGSFRVYGPFNDDDGRDLSWMVKLKGDAQQSAFEVYVGDRGAKQAAMMLFLAGDVTIDGDRRHGGFVLHYDAAEAHPEVKGVEYAGYTYKGQIEVSFDRNVATEQKTVDIDFRDFAEQALLGDTWESNETYSYQRDDNGGGTFHLAVVGHIDDNAFGGVQTNRVVLDARWNPDAAGRARAQILEVDDTDSALDYGDLEVHECFDGRGDLTFRTLTEAYRQEVPQYEMGEEDSCAFGEQDL